MSNHLLSSSVLIALRLFSACRLRKKAQHEANKLKLQGLNEEHSEPPSSSRRLKISHLVPGALIDIIASIKLMILQRYQDGQRNSPPSSSIEVMLDQLMAKKNSRFSRVRRTSARHSLVIRSYGRGQHGRFRAGDHQRDGTSLRSKTVETRAPSLCTYRCSTRVRERLVD